MLRGQETLVRLVGKRRRLDPSSVLSCIDSTSDKNGHKFTTNTPARLVPSGKENDALLLGGVPMKAISSTSSQNSDSTWVKCPVCERDIKGDDHSVNIHLDLCLLKKPKTNFTQSTLKQFASVVTSAREPFPSEKSSSKVVKQNYDGMHLKLNIRSVQHSTSKDILEFTENTAMTACARDECHDSRNDFMEVTITLDNCNCVCHVKKELSESDDGIMDAYKESTGYSQLDNLNISPLRGKESEKDVGFQRNFEKKGVFILETVIVGRRFNQHAHIEENMLLSAVRELDNPSDHNAIKIVDAGNKDSPTIGYISRTIASFLARLLDRKLLDIQGIILKVPEAISEPVPITLRCESKDFIGTKEDAEFLKQTWERIQQAVAAGNGRDEFNNHFATKYLQNFTHLLRVVLERDSFLFNQEEIEFLESFFSLSESARCLLVRLSQRKGPWFRISQISYAEIPDVEQSCKELLASRFCSSADSSAEGYSVEAIKERLHVLTVPELKQVLKATGQKDKRVDLSILKREQLLELVASAVREGSKGKLIRSESVAASIYRITGLCLRVSDAASFLLWRLQRLFFLNGEQDMSTFLLADMGATKYPSYVCNLTRRAFMSREALLSYEQALGVAQAMDMALETDDSQTIEHCIRTSATHFDSNLDLSMAVSECCTDDIFFQRFTAGWVYTTVLTLGVSVLERDRRYSEAIRLLKQLLSQPLCPGRRGYWMARLSIDLEHLGQKEESLQVAETGLKDPRIRNGDRMVLQRRVLRLAKPPRRWKRPSFADALNRKYKEVFITGRPLNRKAGTKSRFYGYDDQQCGVEELALQYYAGDAGGNWQGVHSESGVWMTLFALLMWDVLFADVPNVFWHPFQNAPLDLNTDAFYPSRKSLIDEQIRKIKRGDAPQLLAATWSKHFGAVCRGLNWERHSLEELQVIVTCIGGSGLAFLCMLLAEDYAGWAGGMPDLLLWRGSSMKASNSCCGCYTQSVQSPGGAGQAKLVEVKGPRDRLSEQQLAWIYILMEAGIDVEVCKVLEQPKS